MKPHPDRLGPEIYQTDLNFPPPVGGFLIFSFASPLFVGAVFGSDIRQWTSSQVGSESKGIPISPTGPEQFT
ncbi:hypothetical protein HMPREF9374_3519 [Desmospora sp. 8437]|nr:hypothetical protein HMPREF9374_3519 [Desmospora sp. 8437]